MWAVKGVPPISFRSITVVAAQPNRSRDLLADTERRAASLDYLALQWLLNGVDEEGMDKFVTGLPALIHSPFITDATVTMGDLVANGMLKRVEEHLMSSMSSRELSQAASIARAHACLESLDAIFSVLDRWSDNPRFSRVASALVKSSDVFRTSHDSAFALRAACIRALTFHKLISPFSTQTAAHPLWLPPHLLPLAQRLRIWTRVNSRHWRNQSDLEEAEMRLVSEESGLRNTIIYDGHLINFLVLIRDVLSYAERPTLDLTLVWETLETIVDTITIAQPTASALACSRLEEVHTAVRECLYAPNNLVQRSLPHVAERYSQLLEFMDKAAKELSLVALLSVKSIQPSPTEPFFATGDLRLRYDHIYAKDPFSFVDVLDAFLSNLPAFIESAGKSKARDTIEKIIAVDGLLRNICGHLNTRVSSEMPSWRRDSLFMTCLQVLEQVFTLLKDSSTIRWYELDIRSVLDAANSIVLSEIIGGEPSLHAYCAVGIMINVIIGHLRSRDVQRQEQEEQLFILMIYDWLCLGDEQERTRREERRPGDPTTSREASSPQYLRNLFANGPLQNFSTMAFHMVPHLENEEAIPEIVWETLNMLKDVIEAESLETPIADDPVAFNYFDTVRDRAIKGAMAAKGPTEEQLRLLEYLNTVGGRLGLPKKSMPNPVLLPGRDFVPPNRSEYTPVYI